MPPVELERARRTYLVKVRRKNLTIEARGISCLYNVQLFKVINFQSFSTRHVLKLRLKQCIVTNTHAQFKNDSKKKEPIQKMIHRAKTVNPRRTTLMPIKLPQLASSIQLYKRSIIVALVKAKFSLLAESLFISVTVEHNYGLTSNTLLANALD